MSRYQQHRAVLRQCAQTRGPIPEALAGARRNLRRHGVGHEHTTGAHIVAPLDGDETPPGRGA